MLRRKTVIDNHVLLFGNLLSLYFMIKQLMINIIIYWLSILVIGCDHDKGQIEQV